MIPILLVYRGSFPEIQIDDVRDILGKVGGGNTVVSSWLFSLVTL